MVWEGTAEASAQTYVVGGEGKAGASPFEVKRWGESCELLQMPEVRMDSRFYETGLLRCSSIRCCLVPTWLRYALHHVLVVLPVVSRHCLTPSSDTKPPISLLIWQ